MPHPNSLANLKEFPTSQSGYKTPHRHRMVLRTCRINTLEMGDTLIAYVKDPDAAVPSRIAAAPPSSTALEATQGTPAVRGKRACHVDHLEHCRGPGSITRPRRSSLGAGWHAGPQTTNNGHATETDATYERFVKRPHANSLMRHVSFRDNPWFPPELAREEANLKTRDPGRLGGYLSRPLSPHA